MRNNFQRNNSLSNTSAGNIFEEIVQNYFKNTFNLELKKYIKVEIGISTRNAKKSKKFDLGIENKIIIECKSNSWTEGENIPSAKLTTWNEAMYFFHLTPYGLRKLFVVELFYSEKHQQSLAQYYISTYGHLIPDDVEFWEFDKTKKIANRLI